MTLGDVARVRRPVMLGLGGETPAARIAYELPFYDRFRIVGRHLFLAAFAAATLAGFGISAVQRHAVSWRVVTAAAALLPSAQLQLVTGGVLMISLGLIGAYIARIYDEVKARPRYVVRDRIP